jgi:catechol 2,3-dioxygenase-like lactoylglutathione lyase family enzyme
MLPSRAPTAWTLATSSDGKRPAAIVAALAFVLALGGLAGCAGLNDASAPVPAREASAPGALVSEPWREVTISVTDLDRTARFFRELGDYETVRRGPLSPTSLDAFGLSPGARGESLTLRAPGARHGFVRLVRFDNAGRKEPTRPGARAWDTGCYWSVMVRMKDMRRIYDDAIALGWWTQTPITRITFGATQLDVVVFQGPDGVQVQGYERIGADLPPGFAPFARMSQPFNIMQMTRDREAARRFTVDVLGFETFFYGAPYVDAAPTFMPLGIPKNLTTTVPYKAGIFYPVAGEYGRMEYIEIDGLDGHDFADRCNAPNLGILSVSYPVRDLTAVEERLGERGWPVARGPYTVERWPYGRTRGLSVKSPDGANIEFVETAGDQ